MSETSKLSKYPPAFSKILLSLPRDGQDIAIPLANEAEAAQTRLQYYNFLKFVNRNRRECAHLHQDNRAQRVQIKMRGETLIFSLRNAKAAASLEAGLERALAELNIKGAEVPLPIAPDESGDVHPEALVPNAGPSGPSNPLDFFLSQLPGEPHEN